MEVKSEFLRRFLIWSAPMYLYRVYTWRRGTGEGIPGRRISEERRWFCVPVFLFLWMGQASGSWRRVSGGRSLVRYHCL